MGSNPDSRSRCTQRSRLTERFVSALACAVLAAVAIAASRPVCAQTLQTLPADQPAPRTDQNSMIAHAQLLEKARAGAIDIYFEGDSITRRWGATDYPELMANWKQNFFGWNAADFGWGADT